MIDFRYGAGGADGNKQVDVIVFTICHPHAECFTFTVSLQEAIKQIYLHSEPVHEENDSRKCYRAGGSNCGLACIWDTGVCRLLLNWRS